MSDAPPTDADGDDESLGARVRRLWRKSWSALFKALVVSIGLHLLLSLPVLFHPTLPESFDIEWEGRMGELSEIGHGSTDFDDRREPNWDDMENFETEDEEEPGEQKESDDEQESDQQTTDEEPEKQQEEPDDAGDEEEDSSPDEEPEETEEQQPADDTEPREEPGVGAPEEQSPEPEEEEEPEEEDREPDREGDEQQAVAEADDETGENAESGPPPGVEKTGPSDLPDMRQYGPGNARVTSLVRTDRMRDTDFEPYVNDLLRAVPDYRIALDGTDFDPVADLDSLFMATARPSLLQATFLAARHRLDNEELRETLDSRFASEMDWESTGDRPVRRLVPESEEYRDPRRLLLAEPGLALIGRPAWFEELMAPVDEDSDLGRQLAESDDDGPSAASLMEGLTRIEEAAEDDETLLLVSAYGFRIPDLEMLGIRVNDLPVFQSARLEVADADAPKLTIDLQLRTERDARHFADRCPELRGELTDFLGQFPGAFGKIAGILEKLECERQGKYVVVKGDYEAEEVRSLLEALPGMIEGFQPRSVARLPDGPRAREGNAAENGEDDDEAPGADAGPGDPVDAGHPEDAGDRDTEETDESESETTPDADAPDDETSDTDSEED